MSVVDDAETLTGALAALAEGTPDRDCVVFVDRRGGEQRLTLGEMWRRGGDVAAAMRRRGVSPGAIVLIALPTGAELLAAYCGALQVGAVPGMIATPSNRVADTAVYARRIGAILRNAQAALLYCDDAVAGIMRAAPDELGAVAIVTPDAVADAGEPIVRAPAVGEDLATVQYSSGSTGAPKGVLLTHRAMLNDIRAMRDAMRLTPADVSVNWIPLYHDMGLLGAFLLPLLSGCAVVLIPTMDFMRAPALWLKALSRYRGTMSWAPNFAYGLCAARLSASEVDGVDLRAWRLAITAAEPVLAPTLEAFCARFAAHGFAPAAFTAAWGLAENTVVATLSDLDVPLRVERVDRKRLIAEDRAEPAAPGGEASEVVSSGRALNGCVVQVRDGDGVALPDRRLGTLWIQSDALFSGYRNAPELTARTLVDGWLDTGDRGYMVGGEVFFVARDKDLIVVGGEKYAPQEIEEAINRVPGVRIGCVTAFGVMNAALGTEEVAGVIETRESDEAALAALRDRVRHEVMHATGLALRHVLFVPPGGVEKTTSGKLARSATRRRYADRLGVTSS